MHVMPTCMYCIEIRFVYMSMYVCACIISMYCVYCVHSKYMYLCMYTHTVCMWFVHIYTYVHELWYCKYVLSVYVSVFSVTWSAFTYFYLHHWGTCVYIGSEFHIHGKVCTCVNTSGLRSEVVCVLVSYGLSFTVRYNYGG